MYSTRLNDDIDITATASIYITDDEHIYAKGILLQLLLRSIIVIINDKNIIEPFEEKEDNPSISKSIIESAFIFSLNDLRKAS